MIILTGLPFPNHRRALLPIMENLCGSVEEVTSKVLKRESSKTKSLTAQAPNQILYSKDSYPWEDFTCFQDNYDKDLGIIVFYLPACISIANSLSLSFTVEEAVLEWIAQVQAALSYFKKNRKSALLVNARAAILFPSEFTELCTNRFRFNGADTIDTISSIKQPDAVYSILANQIVKQNPEVIRLEKELRSRSKPCAPYGVRETFDISQTLDIIQKTRNQLAESEQEVELLKSTLDDLSVSTEKKWAALSSHTQSIQEQSENYYMENCQLKEELKLTLKKKKWSNDRSQRKIKRLEEDIKSYDHSIRAIHKSLSWKLTKPVRALASILDLKHKKIYKYELNLVKRSGLFDSVWYEARYPDIEHSKMNSLKHFLLFGGQEGRSPGPDFNSTEYSQKNPDILNSNKNPLVHYLRSLEDE